MDLRTKNLILDLKEKIRKMNVDVAYYISVKHRMEEEAKYVNSDICSIMMSAMDKKLLQEIHVPICLSQSLSTVVIDGVIRQCNVEIKRLKNEIEKLQNELNKLEEQNKNK